MLALYWVTSFIEGLGVSQIYAFLPNRLTEVGVPQPDVGHLVGLLGSLFFLFGLPFIPLWGVWADKYSRKAVIIRSALVEAVVFGVVAASQTPWQLFVGMLLVGFQLGNSGVMMAAIRDVTPGHRLGLAMGLFAASSPLGFGTGPALGGVMIDQLHLSSGAVFALAALLSIGVALMLAIGSSEVRPEVIPTGSTLRLAFGAVRGVMADPTVRWLFVVYGVVFVGRQMVAQYMTLLVHDVEHTTFEVAGAVGPVLGSGHHRGRDAIAGRRLGLRQARIPAGPGRCDCGDDRGFRCPAAGTERGLAGGRLRPGRRVHDGRRGDGLEPPGQRGSGGAALGDSEPDLPAAVYRRHHRSGDRRRRRVCRPAARVLRSYRGGRVRPAPGDRLCPADRSGGAGRYR